MLLTVSALNGMISTLEFNTDRMAEAAASPYAAATDLAEWLVSQGIPFRQAHEMVGDLVRRSLEGEGSFVELVAASDALGPDAAQLAEPGASVTRRNTHGGGSPAAVAQQIQRFRALLGLPEL